MPRHILLMYISHNSGHHRASLAIERSLKNRDSQAQILNINGFYYTNPILEKVINRTYMGVIKKTPEVWEYLYDNPKVFKKVQGLRDYIHNLNVEKLERLLDDFKPDAIACTQAFPCGMIADLKQYNGLKTPLFGILTDYTPHSYWIYDSVNYYVVSSGQAKTRLSLNGVPDEKIKILGIPIDPKFNVRVETDEIKRRLGLDTHNPIILVMGGGQGFGPIKDIILQLDSLKSDLQILVVCGSNKRLYKWINSTFRIFRKRILVFEFIENVNELMELATIIITKPGGLTTAEALAKGLPMILISPIPGQEAKNAQFLTSIGVAEKIETISDLPYAIEGILNNSHRLKKMREAALNFAYPHAADDIAQLILENSPAIQSKKCNALLN